MIGFQNCPIIIDDLETELCLGKLPLPAFSNEANRRLNAKNKAKELALEKLLMERVETLKKHKKNVLEEIDYIWVNLLKSRWKSNS